MKRATFLLLTLTFALACMGFAQRLPETASPSHYQLTFTPNFSDNTFKGEETIEVRVLKPTNAITLNAAEIAFDDVSVSQGQQVQQAKVSLDEKIEMATLTVDKPLTAGDAKINIRYTGQLNDKLRGFYLSQTAKRKYAVTQFEATDARRAFPSFDEPAQKATFDISVVVDKDDTAISNGKIVADTPGPAANKHTIKFATTPKMSTYLVALLVGDWKCLGDEVDGIPLRVCAVPGKEQMGKYALDATKAVVSYFNKYYGIKYPFGKLDQIALPDFEAGAMENTAAITYRETALLVDEKTSSESTKQRVASVIAHEVAHQWFGDLVTMEWWNDIWLNEGFATWMTRKPLKAWKPEWHIELEEVQGSNTSMTGDSVVNTRPIRKNADSRGEINALFDGIAYGKTAAVLRMLESYLGEETFRAGVNNYLKAHAYGNATAEDFWTSLAQASKKPIDKAMASFVVQAGVPFVELKAKCDGNKTQVTASQKRFFVDPALFAKGGEQLWQIPVCMKSLGQDGNTLGSKCELLAEKTQTFTMDGCAAMVFPNSGGMGYYRYSYDPSALKDLEVGIEKALAPAEQVSLVGDEWALVRSGQHDVGDYMNLVDAMKDVRLKPVLDEISQRINYINRNLVTDESRPAFQAWLRSYVRPILAELSYTPKSGEPVSAKELRSTALELLGNVGEDPEVIAKSRELTQQYIKDPASVDPSTADAFVSVAAAHGDATLYEQLRAQLKNASTPDVYYTFFYALSSFRDPALLKRTLEFALTSEVRNQDLRIVGAIVGSRWGGPMAWEWVKQNWDGLMKKASGSIGAAGQTFGSTGNFCDASIRDDVKKFYDDHPIPGTERGFRQSQEQINYCIDMRDRQTPKLANWLQQSARASR
ncbi:MAG TPA: M1 family metallopeptidase [Clostridia bacterium]|nr:M1 family metallopeptidase [Clostridia bacterium]